MFTFRARFRVPPGNQLPGEDREWVLAEADEVQGKVAIRPAFGDVLISDAHDFELVGREYPSESVALSAGRRWMTVIRLAFAARRIGADFGAFEDRASGVGDLVRRSMFDEFGVNLEGDRLGLHVYPTASNPVFFSGSATATVSTPRALVTAEIKRFGAINAPLSASEELGLNLLMASFYIGLDDAKFVQLVTAFEALAEQGPRSEEAEAVLDGLIAAVRTNGLPAAEEQSLVSQLRDMKRQSVNRAARRLVERLGDRRYLEQTPFEFFRAVYEMRNRMVHGSTERPSLADIRARTSPLIEMLIDLVSAGTVGHVAVDHEAE